ncbi:MAG: galactokinase [Clostridia bacterium]|nr:galactokinase [Clostridia bacterium]
MAAIKTLKSQLQSGGLDEAMLGIYQQSALSFQKERYNNILDTYASLYGEDGDVRLFSAPGRTEIGGNHTDHNHGKVLAASINLDTVAAASKRDDNIICEKSAGHDMNKVDLSDLEPDEKEYGLSSALIKGMCAGFKKNGYNIGGFNSTGATQVLSGSGLSSSAAFEVLIGTILNYLYNDGKVPSVEIAKIAQYAENEYFGKPSGLMDQMACSVGGFIAIDFKDPSNPVVEKISFDFAATGHSLCIVDTKGSHADLTDEYAAVRKEMENAASMFEKSVLRDVDEKEFYKKIPEIRAEFGDRAVLRATHFYNENRRVDELKAALANNDFETFKAVITESGHSSFMFNQNVFAPKQPQTQPVSVALSICERVLKGCGAWRVHGGGFAGTIQAFVPDGKLDEFSAEIESVFGAGSCHILKIRPLGGTEIK